MFQRYLLCSIRKKLLSSFPFSLSFSLSDLKFPSHWMEKLLSYSIVIVGFVFVSILLFGFFLFLLCLFLRSNETCVSRSIYVLNFFSSVCFVDLIPRNCSAIYLCRFCKLQSIETVSRQEEIIGALCLSRSCPKITLHLSKENGVGMYNAK